MVYDIEYLRKSCYYFRYIRSYAHYKNTNTFISNESFLKTLYSLTCQDINKSYSQQISRQKCDELYNVLFIEHSPAELCEEFIVQLKKHTKKYNINYFLKPADIDYSTENFLNLLDVLEKPKYTKVISDLLLSSINSQIEQPAKFARNLKITLNAFNIQTKEIDRELPARYVGKLFSNKSSTTYLEKAEQICSALNSLIMTKVSSTNFLNEPLPNSKFYDTKITEVTLESIFDDTPITSLQDFYNKHPITVHDLNYGRISHTDPNSDYGWLGIYFKRAKRSEKRIYISLIYELLHLRLEEDTRKHYRGFLSKVPKLPSKYLSTSPFLTPKEYFLYLSLFKK